MAGPEDKKATAAAATAAAAKATTVAAKAIPATETPVLAVD